MKREIKFRAWDTEGVFGMEYGEPRELFDLCSGEGWEFMQYTGLKDKNGAEIYEDDIVLINHPQDITGDFTNKLGRVFWWDEEGGWYHGHESVKNGSGRPPKRMWEYCEIVGNVHENPELLAMDN